jgi:hypothetical protein
MLSTCAAAAVLCMGAAAPAAAARTAVPAAAPKPCKLLTTDEVSQAIQREVGAPTADKPPIAPPKGTACKWTATEKQEELVARTVKIDVWDLKKTGAFGARYDNKATSYLKAVCGSPQLQAVDVSGASNPACRIGFLTYVGKGSVLVGVAVPNLSNDADANAASESLARDAYARL